jgi:hypothetical protein
VRQPIGRKDSKQTVVPASWGFDSFLYEAAQTLELFSNIQDQKKNHIAVDVLFNAYPMIPLSG